MTELKCTISAGIWELLQNRVQETNLPITHIVNEALANYFEVERHTLYQVSTATALVEGVYQGAVRVGTLRKHGDIGLGTFEDLDGEMAIIDGRFFQVRCDGSVREVGDDVLSPFAVITQFAPEPTVILDQCPDMGHLASRFDELRHSDNIFFALRVDGHFDYVHTRAMCRTEEGTIAQIYKSRWQVELFFENSTWGTPLDVMIFQGSIALNRPLVGALDVCVQPRIAPRPPCAESRARLHKPATPAAVLSESTAIQWSV